MAVTMKNHVPVTMVEFIVDAGATVKQDLPGSYNGFFYTVGGQETFGKAGQVHWLERGIDNRQIAVIIHATEKLRVLLICGTANWGKVVARGPFLMNLEEKIVQLYKDYRKGKLE